MAFLVSNSALDTSKPIYGALTGLASGLSQGLRARAAQDLAQQHLQLQAQDQALRQQAFQHGLQKEADVQDWARRFGEFKAWDSSGAGAQQLQGPPAPGQDQPVPGGVGPPTQGPSTPPGMSGPDQNARMAKIMDLARSAPNLETAHAFLGAVQEDDSKAAVKAHAERLRAKISDRAAHGGFTKRLAGGVEDPSGNDFAVEAQKQLDQFMASAEAQDPQQAAKFLDYLEQGVDTTSAHVIESNTRQHLRQLQGERMQKQLMEKWQTGTAMSELAGAVAYYNTYMGAVDDNPKDLGTVEKEFNDEISGVGPIKRQRVLEQMDMDRMRREIDWYKAKLGETHDQRTDREVKVAETKGQAALGAIGARGDEQRKTDAAKASLVLPPGKEDAAMARSKMWRDETTGQSALTAAAADKRWSSAKTPEERQAIVAEYADLLRSAAGQNGTAQPSKAPASNPGAEGNILNQLRMRAKAEGWNRARVLEEFKRAGLDPNAPAPK